MKFIIKPDSDDLGLILAAGQYKKMWDEYGAKILAAFQNVTGLQIERTQITARVVPGNQSTAGNGYGHPMRLAGADHRSPEFRLMTIVHELTHRLLNSNSYGPHWLKFEGMYDQEIDHRHVYLIEYDVVQEALGEEWAHVCVQYESRYNWTADESPHVAAWNWAMDRTADERATKRRELFETHQPHRLGAHVANY
jgi:hypothetical protein